MPLLNIPAPVQDAAKPTEADINRLNDRPKKAWYTYAPLAFAVFLILTPQLPYYIMLSSFYFVTTHSTAKFIIHLVSTSILTLLTLNYLIICATRDPGYVQPPRDRGKTDSTPGQESEQALLQRDTVTEEDSVENISESEVERLVILGRWCRRCSIRRPDRAHHCSTCGRCILKMDHHCPWLGGNCIGFGNYPAFICFISTAMLLSIYMSAVAIVVVVHLVQDPFTADPDTSPLHALFISLTGAIFALSLGSFVVYHYYLITTGQTTFEHISAFHLLRYLPPPKPHIPPLPSAVSSRPNLKIASDFTLPSRSLDSPLFFGGTDPIGSFNEDDIHLQPLTSNTSNAPDASELIPHPSLPTPPYKPPEEHELSAAQRRFVLRTHGKLRMYDLGWRQNWEQVFYGGLDTSDGRREGDESAWGVEMKERRRFQWRWWLKLVLTGGKQKGTGWEFEKTSNVDAKLKRFAKVLREITEEESR